MRTPVLAAQLEDAQDGRRGDRVHDGVPAPGGRRRRRRDRAGAPRPRPSRRWPARAAAATSPPPPPETSTGRRRAPSTGEVSPAMVQGRRGRATSSWATPERRHLFGEDDAAVNRKTRAVLAAGLTPIVCIGETLAEREADQTAAVLDRQLDGGLAALTPDQVASIIVAYEPGLGHRHRPHRNARAGPGGPRARPPAPRRRWPARRARGPLPPAVRRQRQAGQRRRPVRGSRTSTGRSSAAPASTRTASPRSSPPGPGPADARPASPRSNVREAGSASAGRHLEYHWWLC